MAFTIRRMTRPELDLVVGWAVAEGWNPGIGDADAFFATDSEGFFVAVVNGQIVASLSAVAYTGRYGFIGLYIVRPEWRGRGYGTRLWQAGRAYLDQRLIGLDARLEQVEAYRRSGFVPADHTVRYTGVLTSSRVLAPPVAAVHAAPTTIEPLAAIPFAELLAYDASHVPASRKRFLEPWLTGANRVTVGLRRNGVLAGYGCLRSANEGMRIGPLFANDPAAAASLLESLAAAARGRPVALDVPVANPAAITLVRSLGLLPISETVRMYSGGIPTLPTAEIFAITSLELG